MEHLGAYGAADPEAAAAGDGGRPLLQGDEESVRAFFGDAYPLVAQFHALLAEDGVLRGLIGPREVPRLWERHLVNCGAVARHLPVSGTVVDVGSGAGLPGIVLAAMRPDLRIVLLEPMERRTIWLQEVVDRLELGSVEVLRGRAEEQHGLLAADAVTARAVAPLDKLARWCLPLVRQGGDLLAMKGRQAGDELAAAAAELVRLGGDRGEVLEAAGPAGTEPTYVVRVRRLAPTVVRAPKAARRRR